MILYTVNRYLKCPNYNVCYFMHSPHYIHTLLKDIVGRVWLNLTSCCSVYIELSYVDIGNESGIHKKGILSKSKTPTKPSTTKF